MTPLRGPADADHYRVKVGRYGDRWYQDGDAGPFPSISTIKKASGNDWSYVAMKRAANADTDEIAKLVELDPTQRYERLKQFNKYGLGVAAGRGSIIHLWFEDMLHRGAMRTISDIDLLAMKLPRAALAEAEMYRPAIQQFFDTYQPKLIATEFVCIHETLNGVGYGGTGDVVLEIEGDTAYGDWKSRGIDSDHGAYPEEGAQIAAAARAEYIIVADGPDEVERTGPPASNLGLVVSVKHDGCRLYPVDLDAAFEHFTAMHAWWVARRTERDAIGRPWAPKGANGETTPVHDRDKLRARLAGLLDQGHEDLVRSRWPDGVPPLSKEGHTDDQLGAILTMLRSVEAEVGAQFHDDDMPTPKPQPRPEPQPAPVEVRPDEGGRADPAAVAALSKRFATIPADRLEVLSRITAEAVAVARPISVSADPTVRKFEIARALVRWAESGAPIADLEAAVVDVATTEQCSEPDTGAAISRFTIEQARSLHDALDQSVAA